MNTTELVHFASTGERPRWKPSRPSLAPSYHELAGPVRSGILRARQFLLSEQRHDGSWCASQPGDASLASRWIVLRTYLGDDATAETEAAEAIFNQQLPDGGWSRIPGGPLDVSVSVEAYFALKLAGHKPSDERLARAREAIRRYGGADAVELETRLLLALLGQVSYDDCPPIVPEVQWLLTRTVTPLAIVWSHRPMCDAGLARGVRELYVEQPANWQKPQWPRRIAVAALRACERHGWTPLRRRALNRGEQSLLQAADERNIGRLDFHQLVWLAIALDAVGYSADSQPLARCISRLQELNASDAWEWAESAGPRLRTTPVADTLTVLDALRTSGVGAGHAAARGGIDWLRSPKRRLAAMGDTMEALAILRLLRPEASSSQQSSDVLPPDIFVNDRLANWKSSRSGCEVSPAIVHRSRLIVEPVVSRLIAAQNPDGGWSGASTGYRVLSTAGRAMRPCCSSAADVTGEMLESIAAYDVGRPLAQRAVDRAADYLKTSQHADGSWESATALGGVYATSRVIMGLIAAGRSSNDPTVEAGVNWLVVHQLPSGAWDLGSATQTAAALAALVAAGLANGEPARRAVEFLLAQQCDDGSWADGQLPWREPRTDCCYGHELNSVVWPLVALSRWAVAAAEAETDQPERVPLRLVGAVD